MHIEFEQMAHIKIFSNNRSQTRQKDLITTVINQIKFGPNNDRMKLKSRELQANFQEAELDGRISNLLIKIPRLAE